MTLELLTFKIVVIVSAVANHMLDHNNCNCGDQTESNCGDTSSFLSVNIVATVVNVNNNSKWGHYSRRVTV